MVMEKQLQNCSDAEVFEDDDYEFLQEEEDNFENEQSNYEEEEDLEIENLINLDAEEIISSLDKMIEEYEKSDDIHYISDDNDSVSRTITKHLSSIY